MAVALLFLAPNLVGFLLFLLFPLAFSLVLAFSNWDLRLHNMFKDEPIRFIGLENFLRLFQQPHFWKYLGNTLFLMLGIPLGIAGSLGAAMLLHQNLRGRRGTGAYTRWLASAALVAAVALLAAMGLGATGMTILMVGLVGGVLVAGAAGGTSVYRTLFYLPHFTAGVATYLLWKKLYAPHDGPINQVLTPCLNLISAVVASLPDAVVRDGGMALCLLLAALLCRHAAARLIRLRREGDLGTPGAFLGLCLVLLPLLGGLGWWPSGWPRWAIGLVLVILSVSALLDWRHRDHAPASAREGLGSAAMFAVGVMVLTLGLIGLGLVCDRLPRQAAEGLSAPGWLHDYHWAKPALILMGLWAAIGSNNMLLYLAALSQVPPEQYEAANIDGAGAWARFWHVTWPTLAPTTFFIVVMSAIAGLQGGFEMARTMTNGGPAGSTTVLAYYIYTEGFETGRLGYASAISWVLFAMILLVTLLNWKVGTRYVED